MFLYFVIELFSAVLTLLESIERVILLLLWGGNSLNLTRGKVILQHIVRLSVVHALCDIHFMGKSSIFQLVTSRVIFDASPSFCFFRYHGYKQML